MRYSIELRDRIFVPHNGFGSFAKNLGKNVSKNVVNTVKTFLIIINNFLQMHLKLPQKQ